MLPTTMHWWPGALFLVVTGVAIYLGAGWWSPVFGFLAIPALLFVATLVDSVVEQVRRLL